jgi:phthiocerol/phenolphthiocerol synthesis type-I polyketide synthase D
VRPDGSYIITGGLGGLGLVVARWLVGAGAGRLILNGRSVPSESQQQVLAELGADTEVVFVPGDIATGGVAEQLVSVAEQTGRPLRGLVHAAGVAGDGIVAAVSREDLERVWAPKVAGALRLSTATDGRDLDWWVGFSSMASMLGLPGQLAYTTGNTWLDGLVAWRRASGLPATAIGWGQWSEVGMSSALTYSVLDPITPDEGVEALRSLVGGPLSRVGVGRMRLDRAMATNPEFRDLGYFEKFVEECAVGGVDQRSAAEDGDRSAAAVPDWSTMPAEQRSSELAIRLRAILAHELRMPTSAVDADRPFPELGLDSMMAMTVLKKTQQAVGVDLSASMLWNHPTVALLAAHLAQLLEPLDLPDRPDDNGADLEHEPVGGGVLDELFDSVESSGL